MPCRQGTTKRDILYVAANMSMFALCVCTCLSGQIELYTHIPVMRQFVDHLRSLNFYVCGVFLVDAQFLIDASKFASGVLSALSTMVHLEVGYSLLGINFLSVVYQISCRQTDLHTDRCSCNCN